MTEPDLTSFESPARVGRLRAALVPLTLLALAALLWADPWPFVSPVAAPTVVPAWATDISPVRHPTLRPEIKLAGFVYRCSDCHKLFRSPPETTRTLTWHRDVVLKHGINRRCFNCHHPTSRDFYVDDYGREIPTDQPQLVCAKCHGPVYRDWLYGSHGRADGYWDTRLGPLVRRKCIECHDPHQPPFSPMKPAPPPSTLRMGSQAFPAEHPAVPEPLRIYRQPEANAVEAPPPEPEFAAPGETTEETR